MNNLGEKEDRDLEGAASEAAPSQIIEAIRLVRAELYVGPLPPPEMMREYEDILPGASERIFVQFEEQGRHRRRIEADRLQTAKWQSLLATVTGTVIAILALWIGREFVREGESAWAFALVVLTITMLCGVFVIGKYLTKVELHMRSELVPNDAQPQLPPDTTNTS